MTQQNIIELAKQGNPKAIEVLINSSLQSKGITAKATFKDGFLQVLLESTQVPDKQTLVAFIRKGVTSLGFTSIQKVKVHGKKLSEVFPTWTEEFELVTRTNSKLSTTKSVMHKPSSAQPIVTIQTLKK